MDTSANLILNVDDYEPSRYTRSRILRQAGFRVVEADTGAVALEMLNSQQPHLVLLDVHLPDINGFEVCSRIRSNPLTASTLILQLSATSVGVQSKLQGLAAGADAYLTEPLEPEELVANVTALLRMRRAEQALRSAHETLQAIVKASPLAILATDLERRVTLWNEAAERLFGWTDREVLGRPLPIVGDARRAESDGLVDQVSRGETVQFETERISRDGTLIEVRMSVAPLRTDDEVTGLIAVLEDIRDRRRLEREQARLYREAQQANVAKDEFLAMLSHELRTPLNAIAGWVNIMRMRTLDKESFGRALEVVERSTQLQAKLIEDILDVSRIVGGRLRLDVAPADLATIVVEAVERVGPDARQKNLTVRTHIEQRPAVVRGDRSRLDQIFGNLLSNAVKFTTEGSIDVDLSQRDGRWEVRVRDTGEGIVPEFLPFVFDRFRQADARRSRQHGGLGLGLSIVRHLVEAHGGTVSAESKGHGHGATFTVSLPVADDALVPGDTVSSPRRPELPDLRGVAVLVTEDDRYSLELLTTILRLSGAVVMTATSAAEAMAVIARERPDILVADIGLPHEDGYELIRRIRALPPAAGGRLPAVALTGFASAGDRLDAIEAGYQAHVPKPFDPPSLLALVARLVYRAR
jgi:PAS domain S-box-containing protein